MPKKYELVKRTRLLSKNISLNNLSNFIINIFDDVFDKSDFFLCIDATLFFYNCILNSSIFKELENKKQINQFIYDIYEKVFKVTLNDEEKFKINSDITYILKHKLYTRISDVYYYSYLLYNFFFRPQIYVIGKK